MRIGFTNGCFDILHLGHVTYLAEARRRCDRLVVGLNSDSSVMQIKGTGRPINPQESRLAVLRSLACVDEVVLFDESTPLQLIMRLSPDIIFKGGDYTPQKVLGASWVVSRGGAVEVIELVEGFSTTAIVEKIKKEIT